MKKLLVLLLVATILLGTGATVMARTTIKIWSWSQEQVDFYQDMKEAFEAQNPDIELEFTTIVQDKYTDALSLAFRGGDAPDIFFHMALRPADLAGLDFVQPIDQFLTPEFKATIPEEYFYEGAGAFAGQVYSLPAGAYETPRPGYLYYNKDVMEKVGLDPNKPPQTWSELREMAKIVTDQGKGRMFGLGTVAAPARDLERTLIGMASTVGLHGQFFDYRTGTFAYDSQGWVDLYTVARDILNDGSFFPGWSTLDKTLTRTMFGEGAIAFYFDGIWMPSVFAGMGYGDMNYGVALPPVPDSGRRGYHYLVPSNSPQWYMSSSAKDPQAAWEVMEFMLGKEYQTEFVLRGFGYSPSKLVDNAALVSEPMLQQILSFTEDNSRLWIMPEVKKPDAAKIDGFNLVRNIRPGIWEIMTSALITNKTPEEFAAEAKKYNEEANAVFLKSIEDAQAQGIDITIDDFIFPDWDPMQDYLLD